MRKKIALIFENIKEFDDLISICNSLARNIDIEVHIILLSEVYCDNKIEMLLEKALFNYSLYKVKNPLFKPFKEYSIIEKIRFVYKYKSDLVDYLVKSDITLLLSGVQIIFERVLYDLIQEKKLGIKTISLQRHLLYDDGYQQYDNNIFFSDVVFRFLRAVGLGGYLIKNVAVGYADEYIVTGEVTKDYLVEKGINQKNIHCLGSLEFDNYSHKPRENQRKKNLCYVTSSPTVIGDTKLAKSQLKRIEIFLDTFSDKKQHSLTIRVHPRDIPEQYDSLRKKYLFNLELFKGLNVLDEIDRYDILIGGFSTLLFEALQIGVSVIFYITEDDISRYKNFIDKYQIPFTTDLKDYENFIVNKNNFPNYNKFFTIDDQSSLDKITRYLSENILND